MTKGAPVRFPTATQRLRLDEFFNDPKVQRFIARPWKLITDFDVPDLAGYSTEPGTLYLDRHVHDGRPIVAGKEYPHWLPTLFSIDFAGRKVGHEVAEKTALDVLSMTYDPAHHDFALPCEHAVYQALGMKWEQGQKDLRPWIRRAQLEDIEEPPPDLDCRPYYQDPGPQELKILARLAELGVKDAQHTAHPRAGA